MPVRLTETAITKAMKGAAADGRRDLADAGCPGLRLRLTPSGGASWVLACRDREGRMRRFPLGAWPALGISEARTAARGLHVKVKQEGADPVAERRLALASGRDAKAGVGTLAAVLDLYGARLGGRTKAWPESRKRIDKLFGALLSRPAATITLADLQMTADSYPFPKSAAFSVRTIRPALKWASATKRQYLPAKLAQLSVPDGGRAEARERVLTHNELAALLPTLRASSRPYATALSFMLLTLARRQEAAVARWRHVNLAARIWTIPETKSDRPHTVPLSRQAIDLLRSRLPVDDNGKPIEPDPDALIFQTSTGAAPGNWDRETKTLQKASGTAGWTRHDLRRTGATLIGGMGIDPHVIEAALNHAVIHSKLAGTYNQARYQPQVAIALQRLADALDGIEAANAQATQTKWADI
jgi:integrase